MKKYEDFDDFEEIGADSGSYDFKALFEVVLKSWKKILVWALCGAAFGMMIGLSKPKTYTAKAVVAPEITTRTGAGGLSSLASLAGINMNTMALTDAMHPDLYPEIIKSTNFYIDLFDMPVTFEHKDTLVHTDLYDYMVNYAKSPWWGTVLGLPWKAMDGLKKLFGKVDEFDDAEGHFNVDSLRLTKQQEMVVKALSKNISAAVEKRTYVLNLKVTMQDPIIAAQLANAIIENLQKFVISYRTEKERNNVDYYKKIYDETQSDYLAAQRAYSRYVDSNVGSVSKSSQVHQQHLQNEAQLRYQLYNQTAQSLLAARAKVQQESPVLVVLQPGIAPHIGKPSKVKLTILWFILGGLAGAVWCVLKASWSQEKTVVSEE